MRATLIHNTKAGDGREPESMKIAGALEKLGWSVTSFDRRELEQAYANAKPGDVVIVAGGDGTVGKVAKRFAKTGVPIAVVPTGTANNIARTLGVGVEPRFAIESLERAVPRDVDLGVVTQGEKREERFIEGFGMGVFAYVMGERATKKKHKKLRRALALLAEELEFYEPHRAEIDVDGRDVSGDYVLVAVLNLLSLGPALRLAPQASFDDGELDVVLVRPEHRASFVAHLRRAAVEGDIALPTFEIHRARKVRIGGYGKWAHIDDCSREIEGEVEIRVEPGAVRFLVPPPMAEAPPPESRQTS
jgi:diacylglycerol kinase (ATP)